MTAVFTSVSCGASFNGLAALLGMLNSCASNVSVVNIDNGFGAGYELPRRLIASKTARSLHIPARSHVKALSKGILSSFAQKSCVPRKKYIYVSVIFL